MNYSLIRNFSTGDGVGLRTSVYFSGCQRALEGKACPGCHNSVAWAADSGQVWTDKEKETVLRSLEPDYVSGLSILGGEPLSDFNLDGVLDLAKAAKERFPKKDLWMWSGYELKDILANVYPAKVEKVKDLLNYVDILVDGPFIQDLKNPGLKFRGSSNQKILKIDHENNNEVIDVTDHFSPTDH